MQQRLGPLARLSAAVATRRLADDVAQREAAGLLQGVYERLASGGGVPGGVYLHGPVGSGKTALMDMLATSATGAGLSCCRVHFHELMGHTHRQMHAGRLVPEIGHALGSSWRLVCLDEMQITDIADAAIVSRLLSSLVRAGAAVVATSNRQPADLYSGGLNRHVYIPELCSMLESHQIVTHRLVTAEGDYRDRRVEMATPAGTDAAAGLAARFYLDGASGPASSIRQIQSRLEESCGQLRATELTLGGGRRLPLVAAGRRGCLISFDALCDSPLGPDDYLALAHRFEVVGLTGVPRLTMEMHNAARRLITLIDILYVSTAMKPHAP